MLTCAPHPVKRNRPNLSYTPAMLGRRVARDRAALDTARSHHGTTRSNLRDVPRVLSDERPKAVSDQVRKWVFAEDEKGEGTPAGGR